MRLLRRYIASYIFIIVWFFLISISSFFFPYVIDSIPILKIKSIKIEGLEIIPAYVISTAISEGVKNNVLFLYTHKKRLMEKLNDLSGGAIKEIQIYPSFSLEGCDVKIAVKERKVYATVIAENSIFFFDSEGFKFGSKYHQITEPIIYTSDISLVEEYFSVIKQVVDTLNINYKVANMYVTDVSTIIYTKEGVKISIPPIFAISESLIDKIGKLRFIKTQEKPSFINFISEDAVVIK